MDEASSSNSKQTNPEVLLKTRPEKSHRLPILSAATPKRLKQKTPLEDVCNSSVRQSMNKNSPRSSSGKKRSHKSSSHIPMIGSENIHLEKTPVRIVSSKKGLNIVDVVDVSCGSPSSLSDRLKKLGFSKLSQSFM